MKAWLLKRGQGWVNKLKGDLSLKIDHLFSSQAGISGIILSGIKNNKKPNNLKPALNQSAPLKPILSAKKVPRIGAVIVAK